MRKYAYLAVSIVTGILGLLTASIYVPECLTTTPSISISQSNQLLVITVILLIVAERCATRFLKLNRSNS